MDFFYLKRKESSKIISWFRILKILNDDDEFMK